MIKTIICDCFDTSLKLYNGEQTYRGIDRGQSMIELENGEWLKSTGDGRYYKDGDDNSRWAAVEQIEFDDDGNANQTIEFIGYTEL